MVALVGRLSGQKFRHEVIAAAHAPQHPLGAMDGVDDDVAAGVAHADHQHALALENIRGLVVLGVHHRAAEIARDFRHQRITEMAVGDNHVGVIMRRPSLNVAHQPWPSRLECTHLGVEAHRRIEVEVLRERLEIFRDRTWLG